MPDLKALSAYSNRLYYNNDGDRGGGDSDNDGGDITASAYCLDHPDTVTSSNTGITTFSFLRLAQVGKQLQCFMYCQEFCLPSTFSFLSCPAVFKQSNIGLKPFFFIFFFIK